MESEILELLTVSSTPLSAKELLKKLGRGTKTEVNRCLYVALKEKVRIASGSGAKPRWELGTHTGPLILIDVRHSPAGIPPEGQHRLYDEEEYGPEYNRYLMAIALGAARAEGREALIWSTDPVLTAL